MSRFAQTGFVYVTETGVSEAKPEAGIEYIAVSPGLSLGQKTYLDGLIVAIEKSGEPGLRIADYLRALNEVAIVDWYLLDDGKPVPFSADAIRKLSANDPLVNKALEEFAARNPTLRRKPTTTG